MMLGDVDLLTGTKVGTLQKYYVDRFGFNPGKPEYFVKRIM